MCVYEYIIPSDGNVSISDIAELVHKFLRAETPLKGKRVEGSGEISKKLRKYTNGNFIAESAVFDAVLEI
jgi:hypothetical protein